VTKVSARSLMSSVLPGIVVALVTAGVGFGVQTLVPPGRLTSLLIVSAAAVLAMVGTALLVARRSVSEVIRTALPARGGQA